MRDSHELNIEVRGMTCDHCERTVGAALRSVPGVTEVSEVSYRQGRARIVAGPDATAERIEAAVAQAGYRARIAREPSVADPPAPASHQEGEEFGLLVLGGGSAAFAAAIKASELGAKVALISGGTLGGTCVNVGCVPSKTLIRAAEAKHRRAHHPFDGIARDDAPAEWKLVRGQKDALVGALRQAKYRDVLRGYDNITLFEQRGTVTSPGSVQLADGRRLTGGKLLIATGAGAATPSIPGLAEAGFLDNARAMDLPELPESLVVIGAGFIGAELGQMFARLGVSVTLLARQDRMLTHEDPDIGQALTGYLREDGLTVRTDVTVERVERAGSYRIHVREGEQAEVLIADQLLVATGRTANVAGFGLEELGVALSADHAIVVDEHYQTSVPGVYAAGDVVAGPRFVYVAAYGGALAAENALRGNARSADLTAVPMVTFTDPAVASVGMTEAEARDRGLEPLVARLPMEHVARSLAARETRGFIKLVADAGSRRLLGAQILASEAGEMITEPTLAVRFGLTIEDLTSTFHPYLTLSEGIKLAAQTFDKDVAKLSCCAA